MNTIFIKFDEYELEPIDKKWMIHAMSVRYNYLNDKEPVQELPKEVFGKSNAMSSIGYKLLFYLVIICTALKVLRQLSPSNL